MALRMASNVARPSISSRASFEPVNGIWASFSKVRNAAKEAGTDYDRIPCLGHPVFRDKPVNYDPRERVITEYLEEKGIYNVFLEFYHLLAQRSVASGKGILSPGTGSGGFWIFLKPNLRPLSSNLR